MSERPTLEEDKKQKFPYNSVMFILAKQNRIIISTHRIKGRKEHLELIDKAKKKGCFLYYADVIQIDGKWYTCLQWIVDWESVGEPEQIEITAKPRVIKSSKRNQDDEDDQDDVDEYYKDESEQEPEPVSDEPEQEPKRKSEISCPFCGKKVTSTPGRTLHVKSAHPDKYQEYLENK